MANKYAGSIPDTYDRFLVPLIGSIDRHQFLYWELIADGFPTLDPNQFFKIIIGFHAFVALSISGNNQQRFIGGGIVNLAATCFRYEWKYFVEGSGLDQETFEIVCL